MKIGFFDSGIGGFTIVDALFQQLGHGGINRAAANGIEVYYYMDNKNLPFSEKPPELICRRGLEALSELKKRYGCDAFVIACNTASVLAIDYLRSQISEPIVAVVPALKTGKNITKMGKILLLATRNTVEGDYIKNLMQSQEIPSENLLAIPATALVSVVERFAGGQIGGVVNLRWEIKSIMDQVLHGQDKFLEDCDVVVLGCTHFPIIRVFLQEYFDHKFGRNMIMVDSGLAVANRLLSVLEDRGLDWRNESRLHAGHGLSEALPTVSLVSSMEYPHLRSLGAIFSRFALKAT